VNKYKSFNLNLPYSLVLLKHVDYVSKNPFYVKRALPYSLVLLKQIHTGMVNVLKEIQQLPYSLVLLKQIRIKTKVRVARDKETSILSSSTQTLQQSKLRKGSDSFQLPYSLVLLKPNTPNLESSLISYYITSILSSSTQTPSYESQRYFGERSLPYSLVLLKLINKKTMRIVAGEADLPYSLVLLKQTILKQKFIAKVR